MYIKVISDDSEIKEFCYDPLKSGCIYKATVVNKYYTRVFFSVDDNDNEYDIVVHNRHLRELDLDEIRDFKLNKLGI